MIVRSILIALLAAVCGSAQPAGSDPASAPIATDRPAVTDSSVVVPVGSLQAENGFADTVSHGQRTLDGPETWVRFGIASKTEVRLIAPDYFGPEGLGS